MSAHVRSSLLDSALGAPRTRRRPAWRQRLVEVERGFAISLRGDGVFYIHFFSATVVIAAGLILGVSLLEWAVIVLSITMVLSAEMFRQVLKALFARVGHYFDDAGRTALRVAAAAVVVTIAGATLAVGLTFARSIFALFSPM